jgi:hypothetical protein
MNRLVTWLLCVAVVLLAVQSRKQARSLREMQAQRRWMHEAKQRWEGWKDTIETHDGERDVIRARMEQLAEGLGIEWEQSPTDTP